MADGGPTGSLVRDYYLWTEGVVEAVASSQTTALGAPALTKLEGMVAKLVRVTGDQGKRITQQNIGSSLSRRFRSCNSTHVSRRLSSIRLREMLSSTSCCRRSMLAKRLSMASRRGMTPTSRISALVAASNAAWLSRAVFGVAENQPKGLAGCRRSWGNL